MVCIPVMDPSRTLPVFWVSTTQTPFGTAQRTSQNLVPLFHAGPGPAQEVTANAYMSISGVFSETMLFARCRVTMKLAMAKDKNRSS